MSAPRWQRILCIKLLCWEQKSFSRKIRRPILLKRNQVCLFWLQLILNEREVIVSMKMRKASMFHCSNCQCLSSWGIFCQLLSIINTVKLSNALILIISTVYRRVFHLFEVSVIFFALYLRKMNYNELSEIPYFGETTSNITLLSL